MSKIVMELDWDGPEEELQLLLQSYSWLNAPLKIHFSFDDGSQHTHGNPVRTVRYYELGVVSMTRK